MNTAGVAESLGRQRATFVDAWSRLARVNLGAKWVMLFVLALNLMSIFIFEIGKYSSRAGDVLVTALAAELVFWAVYTLSLLFLNRVMKDRSSLLFRALAVIGLSHLARSAVREALYFELGLTSYFALDARILGDLSLAIFFLMGIAYMHAAVSELGAHEQGLQVAQNQLIADEDFSRGKFDEFDSSLRARVEATLDQPLSEISRLVRSASGGQLTKTAQKIQDLIAKKVRPLSVDLWSQLMTVTEPALTQLEPARSRFPERIIPGKDFRPGVITVLAGSNIFFTTPGLSSWAFALQFLLVMASFTVIAGVLVWLFPKSWSLNLLGGAVAVASLALLAWLPARTFLQINLVSYPDLAILPSSSSVIIAVTAGFAGFWSAFKRERLAYLSELEALNDALARQTALNSQAAWIASRAWTYLIHGTVQSSLTIALSRLRAAEKLDDELLELVSGDIERARGGLETRAGIESKWQQSLPDIQATWTGVCEMSYRVSRAANQLLSQNSVAATCVAEIAKELVSNAFRHGGATEIDFKVQLSEAGDVLLTSTNNGDPLPEGFKPGVGFAMVEELTSDWRFRAKNGHPFFEATIPVSQNN